MDGITTNEAAEILGVSRRRVIALIEQGRLTARKFGGVYAIARADLAAVRERKNGRPQQAKNGAAAGETDKPFKTIFDLAPELIGALNGKHKNLPTDLSTNKKHLEGFGRD